MKLTTDHMVQIFCAALSSTIQAEAVNAANKGPSGTTNPVDKASLVAAQAIAKLQGNAWAEPKN